MLKQLKAAKYMKDSIDELQNPEVQAALKQAAINAFGTDKVNDQQTQLIMTVFSIGYVKGRLQ